MNQYQARVMERHPRRWSTVLRMACGLLVFTAAGVGAQTACIQNAPGLPGNYGGPPIWWGASANTAFDDPLWVNAWNQPAEDGTGEMGRFRALHDASGLYLSWLVAYDPGLGNLPTKDIIYVGFKKTGTMNATILRINLNSVSPASATVVGRTMKQTTDDGTTWTEVPDASLPTWYTESVRGWVFTDAGYGTTVWAIQVHVPISAGGLNSGLDLGSDFKMWYEAKVGTPTGVANKFRWPLTTTWVTGLTVTSESYPSPGGWGDAHLSTGANDQTCTNGVSISASDIGTTNVPDYQVNISANQPYPVNTFFARPLNNTGSQIDINKIKARFRIANWGSIGVNATWEDIPGGGAVWNDAVIPVGAQPSNFYPIHFDHAFSPGESIYDGIIAGTKSRDQCLLVELSAAPGAGITFINSSVRRNLQFVGGSIVDRTAEISVPAAAGGRDVYLQVQQYLMPAQAGPGDTLRDSTALFQPQVAVAVYRRPTPTIRQLTRFVPSYRVHVYYTTGDYIWINGVKYPLLEQQSSFGFFVFHRGPLEGWGSLLDGAEPIAPNWYRIRQVTKPVKIRTQIQARVKGETPIGQVTPPNPPRCGHQGSSGLVVGMVGIGVIVMGLRRRKKERDV